MLSAETLPGVPWALVPCLGRPDFDAPPRFRFCFPGYFTVFSLAGLWVTCEVAADGACRVQVPLTPPSPYPVECRVHIFYRPPPPYLVGLHSNIAVEWRLSAKNVPAAQTAVWASSPHSPPPCPHRWALCPHSWRGPTAVVLTMPFAAIKKKISLLPPLLCPHPWTLST